MLTPRPGTGNVRRRNHGLVPAHAFPPKFDLDHGTRGWFLCNREQPHTAKKIFLVHRTRVCAPYPFPQLKTLTNKHQRTESQLTGL